jgi:hypothetical protein
MQNTQSIISEGVGTTSVDLLQTSALVATVIGLIISTLTMITQVRASEQARATELSWSMYLAYTDPAIRRSRGMVEELAHSPTCPKTAEEYKRDVADAAPWRHFDDNTLDMNVRRLLRFYNQLAILVRKDLIDADFVFSLVGPGLETCWPALCPAISYYQRYYGGNSGTESAEQARPIYSAVRGLHSDYADWRNAHKSDAEPAR